MVYRELIHSSGTFSSAARHVESREFIEKHFNIFSPANVFRSMVAHGNSINGSFAGSETFGFARLIDLSAAEITFLATGSFMERVLFTIMNRDRKYLDGMLDMFMEAESDDSICSQIGSDKVRAVTRMLLIPSKAETALLRRRLATGPWDVPNEALVLSHQDRLLSNIRLLHSAYSFIPTTRAPPVSVLQILLLLKILDSIRILMIVLTSELYFVFVR